MAGCKVRENQSEKCTETANELVQAIYKGDDEKLLELLSEESRSILRNRKISMDGTGLSSLAAAIGEAWNCPRERVLVLAADFDHPHLKGRVRVPVILDPRGSVPEGYILSEGAPLPSSCGVVCVLLIKEGEEWKVDNISELAPCSFVHDA